MYEGSSAEEYEVSCLDVPGIANHNTTSGYFPLHEDKSRVHRPHPFQTDVNRARNQSISLAVESIRSEGDSIFSIPAAMSGPSQVPGFLVSDWESQQTGTPVASYLPTGAQDAPLPVGKYYPSNYERNHINSNQGLRPPSAASGPSSFSSDSSVPKHKSSSHARTDSEAKRRLQQYQRDMIAQATRAANEVLGGSIKRSGTNLATSLRNAPQLGGSVAQNPITPDLLPLGSPGPVTPMDLEGGDSGNLTRGRPLSGPDAHRAADEIARATRAEEQRRLREGATSPAVELGPVPF